MLRTIARSLYRTVVDVGRVFSATLFAFIKLIGRLLRAVWDFAKSIVRGIHRIVLSIHGWLTSAIEFASSFSIVLSIVSIPALIIWDPLKLWGRLFPPSQQQFRWAVEIAAVALASVFVALFLRNLSRTFKLYWVGSTAADKESQGGLGRTLASLLAWAIIGSVLLLGFYTRVLMYYEISEPAGFDRLFSSFWAQDESPNRSPAVEKRGVRFIGNGMAPNDMSVSVSFISDRANPVDSLMLKGADLFIDINACTFQGRVQRVDGKASVVKVSSSNEKDCPSAVKVVIRRASDSFEIDWYWTEDSFFTERFRSK